MRLNEETWISLPLRGEGRRAANLIRGHALDQCQGRRRGEEEEVIGRNEGAEVKAENECSVCDDGVYRRLFLFFKDC